MKSKSRKMQVTLKKKKERDLEQMEKGKKLTKKKYKKMPNSQT